MTDSGEFKKKSKSFINSFNNAVRGVTFSLKHERNMRFHILAAILVLIASLLFNFTKIEMILLTITISLVLISELFNTAIEQAVDLASGRKYNEIAKVSKDVAAGAVLVAAVNSLFVGYLIFFDRIIVLSDSVFVKIQKSPSHLTFVATALVLIITVVLKSLLFQGRGTPFQGGTVSGHAALAFCGATIGSIVARNVLVTILLYGIALLVAESRVEGKIHSIGEVISGAIVGILIAVIVFKLMTG